MRVIKSQISSNPKVSVVNQRLSCRFLGALYFVFFLIFSGAMDPAMMSMMQEHMKRMRPEDIQRMQQMMTPEMTRMAMENMKNMRPEDLKLAAEQMKNLTPDQISQMSNLGGGAGVPPVMNQRRQYELNAAATLKNQGNQLHGIGKYDEAVDKYLRAKKNLLGHSSSEAVTLRRACLVNLMSCYLKTKDYGKVVECGAEALKEDPSNVKALYRRGQALKELGNLKEAVIDLRRAAELSPEDETLASVLGDVRKQMGEKGEVEEESKVVHTTDGVIIEDITDQETLPSSENQATTLPTFPSTSPLGMNNETWQMQMEALKSNPGMISQMQSMMANMDPKTMAAVSGGAFSPEMAKVAGDMMKNMSPNELETYLRMGSSMRGSASTSATGNSSGVKTETATETETETQTANETGRVRSSSGETGAPSGRGGGGESLSRGATVGNLSSETITGSGMEGGGVMPSMQQLQEQMKDPAMMQSMLEMMKGIPPEMMAAMGAKAGIKMTPEQARQAQESLSQMTPEQMATMMKWGERVNQAKETMNETKKWILKRPLLILAFIVLLLALGLHYFGYVG